MKIVKRYKFLRLDGRKIKSDSGDTTWKIGEWQKIDGELDICHNGFHCSKEIDEAFSYVTGEAVAIAECRGKSIVEDNKECWEEMRLIEVKKWDKKASVALAIHAAELVIKNYEKEYPNDSRPRQAIEAAKKVLLKNTKKNRDAAESAAESAARSTWSAWSAGSAAGSAAWSAAGSAWSAATKKIRRYMKKQYRDLEEIK